MSESRRAKIIGTSDYQTLQINWLEIFIQQTSGHELNSIVGLLPSIIPTDQLCKKSDSVFILVFLCRLGNDLWKGFNFDLA